MVTYLSKIVIVTMLLSIYTLTGICEENRNVSKDVKVTYVGNAGFLIETGNRKILIDALFEGFSSGYKLPVNVREKVTLAKPPFDNVDLILVTHAHGDHFSAEMVREHMKHNPNTVFASTQQCIDTLNGFSDRSIVFNPSKEMPEKKQLQDITIEAFFLPHGPNSKTVNIGFLISLNGITVFQTGDVDFGQFTFEEFRSLQLPEKKIDIAFIQHYYLTGNPSFRRFIAKGIMGEFIIPIHYHYTVPAFDAEIITHHYPYAIIFQKELQTWYTRKIGKFPVLKGDYIGQPLPGETPEFLPLE